MSGLLQSSVDNAPQTWDSYYSHHQTNCFELRKSSSEFQTVENLLQKSFAVTPSKIHRVQNAGLWGCYLLTREQYTNKCGGEPPKMMQLWHSTSVANAESIVETNLDWRRSVRTKFGEGVSFSPDAKYANTQANLSSGTSRALILARVLVGETCDGCSWMKIPSGSADTSVGNSNRVYVKYYDNEFYPEYVVYYDSPPINSHERRRYF